MHRARAKYTHARSMRLGFLHRPGTPPMPGEGYEAMGDGPALPPVSDDGSHVPDGVPAATSASLAVARTTRPVKQHGYIDAPSHDTYGAAAMLTTTQSRCGYVSSRGDCRNRIIPGSIYCDGHTCVVPGPTGPCLCAKSSSDSDCGAHG